jgi:hypothetical protein
VCDLGGSLRGIAGCVAFLIILLFKNFGEENKTLSYFRWTWSLRQDPVAPLAVPMDLRATPLGTGSARCHLMQLLTSWPVSVAPHAWRSHLRMFAPTQGALRLPPLPIPRPPPPPSTWGASGLGASRRSKRGSEEGVRSGGSCVPNRADADGGMEGGRGRSSWRLERRDGRRG